MSTRAAGPVRVSADHCLGANSCVLHYVSNDQPCKKGDILLIDAAAAYANYNADLTRTIPVGGRYTRRQKQVYNAVLRVLRASIRSATVGKLHRDWQKEAQMLMNEELLRLGLLKPQDIKRQTPDEPACRKYFPHGLGHPLGLDVHDVGSMSEPFAPGWVLTVEPGIYLPEEGLGVRIENDIVVTDVGPVDLMAGVPVEADEIEDLMHGALTKATQAHGVFPVGLRNCRTSRRVYFRPARDLACFSSRLAFWSVSASGLASSSFCMASATALGAGLAGSCRRWSRPTWPRPSARPRCRSRKTTKASACGD